VRTLAIGELATCWVLWILAPVRIEIGVYSEDRQLADRFQDVFIEYSSHVKAYIPFFR